MGRKMKVGVAVWLAVIMSFAVTGCGSKKAITADDFTKTMEGKDYNVVDLTDQFDSDKAKSATVASNDNYKIEFYVASSKQQAKDAFDINQQEFEDSKEKDAPEKKESSGKYNSYEVTSGGQYRYVSCIGDTLLYVSVEEKYKDEVQDILTELGY